MTIEEPRVNIALTTNDDRTSILIRRSDADAARPNEQMRWVSWQLAAIAPGGYMAACDRVGNAVWRLLHAAHPALFEPHPLLKPPDILSELDQVTDLVHNLIRRSVNERTSAYVTALDAIFAHNAALLAQTELPGQWSTLREAFLRHDRPA